MEIIDIQYYQISGAEIERERGRKCENLLIEEADLAAGVPPVLLENGRQIPPLQLPQAPYHRACEAIDNRKVEA